MALEIVWTPQAEKGLDKVIGYLEEEWTENEIFKLEQNINSVLFHIRKYPRIYPEAGKHKNVYKALVDKNNYLIYRVQFQKRRIEIINFRGTRQRPLE